VRQFVRAFRLDGALGGSQEAEKDGKDRGEIHLNLLVLPASPSLCKSGRLTDRGPLANSGQLPRGCRQDQTLDLKTPLASWRFKYLVQRALAVVQKCSSPRVLPNRCRTDGADAASPAAHLARRVRSSWQRASQASTVVKIPTTFWFCTITAEPYLFAAIVSTTSSSGASGLTV
jgi:hypothetical protein